MPEFFDKIKPGEFTLKRMRGRRKRIPKRPPKSLPNQLNAQVDRPCFPHFLTKKRKTSRKGEDFLPANPQNTVDKRQTLTQKERKSQKEKSKEIKKSSKERRVREWQFVKWWLVADGLFLSFAAPSGKMRGVPARWGTQLVVFPRCLTPYRPKNTTSRDPYPPSSRDPPPSAPLWEGQGARGPGSRGGPGSWLSRTVGGLAVGIPRAGSPQRAGTPCLS